MQRIGRYEVVGRLDSDARAEVLLGRHPSGRTVVLRCSLGRDAATALRLRAEGRLGLRLGWSHFARTEELLEHEGEPVVVMEWLPGVPLEALWRVEPLTPWAAAKVGAEVASALAVLHAASEPAHGKFGAVHGRLDSRNVYVDVTGRARVTDLGFACLDSATRAALTQLEHVEGGERYLAPEVLEAAELGPPADVWALGAMLLEGALGRPIATGSPREIAAAVSFKDPFAALDAQALEVRLRRLLRSLLQKEPEDRPTAAQATGELALLADELDQSPGDHAGRLRRLVERARTAVAVGLVDVGTENASLVTGSSALDAEETTVPERRAVGSTTTEPSGVFLQGALFEGRDEEPGSVEEGAGAEQEGAPPIHRATTHGLVPAYRVPVEDSAVVEAAPAPRPPLTPPPLPSDPQRFEQTLLVRRREVPRE